MSELHWQDQLKSQNPDNNLGGANIIHKTFNNPVALLWASQTLWKLLF